MLTKRQNFLETIRGGNPDRFVKQMEFMEELYVDPWNATNAMPQYPGDKNTVDSWGITWSWPEGTPGPFPVQTPEKKVIEDITKWESVVKHPPLEYDDVLWDNARKIYEQYDRNEVFVGPSMSPGLFETCHHMMGMEETMINMYEEPEALHELIDYILEWHLNYVKQMAENLHPDIVLCFDDWGSDMSTFMSVDMFREFYLEPYKKLYGLYKELGCEIVIHHSDSYAETFVPSMIEMGIDVWQGGTRHNNLKKVIDEYGGKISIMSGIDSTVVDRKDWNRDLIRGVVESACETMGTKYFIPNQTQGGIGSTFEGVYEVIDEEIDRMSEKMFRR